MYSDLSAEPLILWPVLPKLVLADAFSGLMVVRANEAASRENAI